MYVSYSQWAGAHHKHAAWLKQQLRVARHKGVARPEIAECVCI